MKFDDERASSGLLAAAAAPANELIMLVPGDDEDGVVPVGAGPQRLVHALHKALPVTHVVRRVLVLHAMGAGKESEE